MLHRVGGRPDVPGSDFSNNQFSPYELTGNQMCGSANVSAYPGWDLRKNESIRQAELIKNRNPALVLFAVGFGKDR